MTGNNFVNSTKSGVIVSSVMNAQGEPLIGVTVKLFDSDETLFAMTMMDANGFYKFMGLPIGNYTVQEINTMAYPNVISDEDETLDGVTADNTTSTKVDK